MGHLSKHCMRCNRCTVLFDHHCKWVNNCIGKKNYKTFIVLILFVFILEIFIFVLSGITLINTVLSSQQVISNIKDMYSNSSLLAFQILLGILVFEGLVFSVLLGYLIILHIFLSVKGITTYEYILQKRCKTQVTPRKNQEKPKLNDNNTNKDKHSKNLDNTLKVTPRI